LRVREGNEMIEENKVQEQESVEGGETAITPSMEDKIFDNIFGGQEDTFVAQDAPKQETIHLTEEPKVEENNLSEVSSSEPKNDNDQFQYWQSQADKRQAELDELKASMADMEEVLPIARHLKRNPELLSQVQESQKPKEETVRLERPVKPSKPAGYDHSEALEDPSSSSAKYLVEREEYMDNMSDYMIKMDEQRVVESESKIKKQEKLVKEQELIRDLQMKYSYTPEQAQDFMNKMASPETLSLDNLVKLHQIDSGTANVLQVSNDEISKQQVLLQRQEKTSIPKPIGVQPGASVQSPKTSTEDELMNAMIDQHKKVNPW